MVKAILFLLLSPFSCIMCNSSEVTSLPRVKNRVEIVDAVFCSKQPRLAQIKLLFMDLFVEQRTARIYLKVIDILCTKFVGLKKNGKLNFCDNFCTKGLRKFVG